MENAEFFQELTKHTIVLMGLCFMLGSLFTIFILLILDMVRAGRMAHMDMLEQQRQQVEAEKAAQGRDAA